MAGRFIVLEGTDGSGKSTQLQLLATWLRDQKHLVTLFKFPQYGKPSAYFVEQYLSGRYGKLANVGPHPASLFYALDRYDAAPKIRAAISAGHIVLSDRYVASNMAHQGGKLRAPAERQAYFDWNENLEYELLGVPRPDLTILLHVPALTGQRLAAHKKQTDIHENDLQHLSDAEAAYLELAKQAPDTYTLIQCSDSDKVLPITDIQNKIRSLVADILIR